MPILREKKPRTLNATVSLRLTLTEAEAEKLAKAYPDEKRNVAMNTLAMSLLTKFFSGK